MAMRLYKKDEIIAEAKGLGLKFATEIEDHLLFIDTNGEPFSVPCPDCGCADYLFDIFIAKASNLDTKVIGFQQKKYDVIE